MPNRAKMESPDSLSLSGREFVPHRKLRGKVEIREIEFPSLKRNPLGDPSTRPVVVYLPPGYYGRLRRYPLVIALTGFTGTSLGVLNADPFLPNLAEQADLLISQGVPPFIVAVPDAFTRY